MGTILGSVGESFCTASRRFGRERNSRPTTVSDVPALAIAALGIAAERRVTSDVSLSPQANSGFRDCRQHGGNLSFWSREEGDTRWDGSQQYWDSRAVSVAAPRAKTHKRSEHVAAKKAKTTKKLKKVKKLEATKTLFSRVAKGA